MPFHDTAWWHAAMLLSMTAWLLFMISDVLRYKSVPGTHRRYVWATVEWAVVYPALGFPVMSLVEDTVRNRTGSVIADMILTVLWVLHFTLLRNSGDDNWFKRTGKKLRRWVSQNMPNLSPLPSGAGA